jgi:hypothetical protein
MQRELTGLDVLFLTALFDQPPGQLGAASDMVRIEQ